MRSVTLFLLICAQVLLIDGGYGGSDGYGGSHDYGNYLSYLFHFKDHLTHEAFIRIKDLMHRFGNPAGVAVKSAYDEIGTRLSTTTKSSLENYLCNKVKAAVNDPPFLSYVKKQSYHDCQRVYGEEAQIFNATEQQLAQAAANGQVTMLALKRHGGAYRWLRQAVTYSNWDSGQPNIGSYYHFKFCGAMNTNGKWKMVNCHNTYYVLCEKRPIACNGTPMPPTPPTTTRRPPAVPEPTRVVPAPTNPKTDSPEKTYGVSGDISALKDSKSETKTLVLRMGISYASAMRNTAGFASAFYTGVRRYISPKLIAVTALHPGSTVVTFTVTAPKDSLLGMIRVLKAAVDMGNFQMTYMSTIVRPAPGATLETKKEETKHGDVHYGLRILIYIAVIIVILLIFAAIILAIKFLFKKRSATKPSDSQPPIFWVNGVPNPNCHIAPPSDENAPPAYSDVCKA